MTTKVKVGDTIKVSEDRSKLRMIWNDEYATNLAGKELVVEDTYIHSSDEVWATVTVHKEDVHYKEMNWGLKPQGYKIPPRLFKLV